MRAIIETGGKQYTVNEGDVIYIEKLPLEEGDSANFEKVLAVFDGGNVTVGSPFVEGASVNGSVIKNGKNKKIIVFKMKAKKTYRKKTGHRQHYTKVQIDKIVLPK